MDKKTFIYALQDPDTNHVRYVGKSNNPEARYKHHLGNSVNKRKTAWIRGLLSEGKRPNLIILDEVEEVGYKEAETSWIKLFLAAGNDLLNWIYSGYSNSDMRNQ